MCYRINFLRSGRSISVGEGLTLAQVARKAKVKIPTDCNHGMCGTCEVLTHSQGWVRACITLVDGDLEVEI